MLLPEEDAEVFKSWVLPKLETISDADAEVLADYVIALVTTKDTDANIRHNCLESLSDFLQDNTAPFVDEVIGTLKSKSYAPRANANSNPNTTLKTEAPAPIPSIVGTSTSEYLPNPAHAFNTAPLHAPKGPAATRASNGQHRLRDRPTGASSGANAQQEHGQRSRKRKQNERDTSQSRDGHAGHDRPVKQTARRGGKNGRMGGLNAQAPAFAPTPTMPPFNPINAFGDVPPFDPTNPMALMAMAAAFGLQMPGTPPMPGSNGQEKSNIRCADYDTKGFCAAGSFCPYEHGLEYDQGQPAQALNGGRGRPSQGASSHSGRSGRTRASFSLLGPTRDRTNTTLVVEQIPEESFSEEHVRDFFGKFGTLTDVQMQAYKRLAIVKYETHEAANAAYNSPKAIFDNRFVKLYWHRSDMDLGPQNHHNGLEADGEEGSYGDTEMLDPEEIERRQAEAQRAFEERQKKAEEAAAKAEEIDRKLQETNAEILRVRRELAKASGDANGELEEDFSQDLATLQAEAENLFAQQDAAAEAWRGNTRGAHRGAYRARGYAPRARGSRGGYRGRGAPFGSRTGVKRLDNRPRRIAVKDVEPGSRKDEALRQHLFNAPDIVSTEQHPQRSDTLIITFGERYQAEAFIDTAHQIPDVGKLDMEWVSNDAFGGVKSADAEADGHDSDGESAASVKEENNAAAEEPIKTEDADMDVAEDEDQWL